MRFLAAPFVLLLAMPVFAGPKSYPVKINVVASWGVDHKSIAVVAPTPSRTNCTSNISGDTINTDCTTQPGSSGGAYEVVDRTNVTTLAFIDSGNAVPIKCANTWYFSRCYPLGEGFYVARWDNERHTRLRILVPFQGQKKPKEVVFDVN